MAVSGLQSSLDRNPHGIGDVACTKLGKQQRTMHFYGLFTETQFERNLLAAVTGRNLFENLMLTRRQGLYQRNGMRMAAR